MPAYLVAVSNVSRLELRERHVAAVDVVEDGGEFHGVAYSREQTLERRQVAVKGPDSHIGHLKLFVELNE